MCTKNIGHFVADMTREKINIVKSFVGFLNPILPHWNPLIHVNSLTCLSYYSLVSNIGRTQPQNASQSSLPERPKRRGFEARLLMLIRSVPSRRYVVEDRRRLGQRQEDKKVSRLMGFVAGRSWPTWSSLTGGGTRRTRFCQMGRGSLSVVELRTQWSFTRREKTVPFCSLLRITVWHVYCI